MPFLKQSWYFAEWALQLEADKPLGLELAGESIVLYRTAAGVPAAIGGRCPHRFAPLHLGVVKGDAIECPYHGLQFDSSGRCVHSPHHDGPVPAAIKVPSYTVAEQDGALWIWMDPQTPADRSAIPDMHELVEFPAASTVRYRSVVQANFELLVDNLLDATHADYVHKGTLGNGEMTKRKPLLRHEGNHIIQEWLSPGKLAFPNLARFVADPQNVDSWLIVRWMPPGIVRLELGATACGAPRDEGVRTVAFHIMMPRTDRTATYNVSSVRNYAYDNAETSKAIAAMVFRAFDQEDKPIIEAQQQMMGEADFWTLDPILLRGDAAGVQARRKLRTLMEVNGEKPVAAR